MNVGTPNGSQRLGGERCAARGHCRFLAWPVRVPSLLLGGLLAALLLAGCDAPGNGIIRVAGEIEARDVAAGSRIGGRVVDVLAQEGDAVTAGEVLVRLDDRETRAALAAAEAQLALREATLDKLRNGATPDQRNQMQAAVDAAAAQLALAVNGARDQEVQAAAAALAAAAADRRVAQQEFERVHNLHAQQVIPQRQLDQAQAARDAAEARYAGAREQHALVIAGARDEEIALARAHLTQAEAALAELIHGTRAEDIATAVAARDAASAELERVHASHNEMTITAPMDGVVESLDVLPGDLVRPGPLVRLVDPDRLELTLYVGADLLGHLQTQQQVEFTTDAFGDETFTGTIIQIASEGEFTPRNLQTEEERVQQVFAVKLRLDSAGGRLRPGMSATAHLSRNNGPP